MASKALLERTCASPHYPPMDNVVFVSSLEYLLLGELAFLGYLMLDIDCQLNVMWNHLGNILLCVSLRIFPKIFT